MDRDRHRYNVWFAAFYANPPAIHGHSHHRLLSLSIQDVVVYKQTYKQTNKQTTHLGITGTILQTDSTLLRTWTIAPKTTTTMDPMKDDPFRVLGFPPKGTASEDELRRAYRTLALRCHPDRVDPTATDEEKTAAHHEFARISEAYQTCTDKVKLHDWRQQQEDLRREARYHRAREARAGTPGAGAATASSAASVATAPDARGRGTWDRRARSKSPGLFGRGGSRNGSPSQRSVRTTLTGRSRSPGPLKNNNNVSPTSNKPKIPKARFMPFSSPKKQQKKHPIAKNPSAPWQRQKQEQSEGPVVPPPPPMSTPTSRQKARPSSPNPPTRRSSDPPVSTSRVGSPSRLGRSRSKSPGPLRRYPSLDSSRSNRGNRTGTASSSRSTVGVSSSNTAPKSSLVRRAGTKADILGSDTSAARPTTSMVNSLHASSPQISASSRKKQPVHPLVSPRRVPKKMTISRKDGNNDEEGKTNSCPPKKNKSMPPTVLLTADDDDDDPPPKKSTKSKMKNNNNNNNRERKKVKDDPPIKNKSMPSSSTALLIDALPSKKNTRKKLKDSPPKKTQSTPPSALAVTGGTS